MKLWPTRVARTAEAIIGVAYIIAAILKAADFNAFLPQIHAYQIVSSNSGLIAIAFAALALETGLGICLVLGSPWRRLVHCLSAGMLCFFTGVILYAWLAHGLEDCGCFGKVKVTPPQAVGKNVVLLLLNAVAFYGLVFRGEVSTLTRGGHVRTAVAVVVALVLCMAVVPQLGTSEPPESSSSAGGAVGPDPSTGPFSGYTVESDFGEIFDLASGEYLVALLSMDCEHCMDSVPQLNEFSFDSSLPPLVAICLEPEAGDMEDFKVMTQPQFPMHNLGDKTLKFFPLLETASSPPRLVYVRDGATVHSWDGEIPEYETLIQDLSGAGFAENDNLRVSE